MIKLDAETSGKSDVKQENDMPSFTLQDEDDNLNLGGEMDVRGM
jgi:twitching motility protein PilU